MDRAIICTKWGAAFPATYVNVLYNACMAHLDHPARFICVTNEAEGLHPDIDVLSIPEMDLPDRAWRSGAWPKIGVFKPELFDFSGRVLFIDLDTFINGSLEPFFEGEGFKAIGPKTWPYFRREKTGLLGAVDAFRRNRKRRKKTESAPLPASENAVPPNTMGTGIFAFDVDAHTAVYEAFIADIDGALATYDNEQHFVEDHLEGWTAWPPNAVASFKYQLRQPLLRDIFVHPKAPSPDWPVLAFHGDPRPLDMVTNLVSSRREFPHVWLGKVRWLRDYWQKYDLAE